MVKSASLKFLLFKHRRQWRSVNQLINVECMLPVGRTGKDIVLAIIGKIGTAGGTGCTIEFAGAARLAEQSKSSLGPIQPLGAKNISNCVVISSHARV